MDALGWRRVLDNDSSIQPPDAFLSRGLEVHPHGSRHDLEVWAPADQIPEGGSLFDLATPEPAEAPEPPPAEPVETSEGTDEKADEDADDKPTGPQQGETIPEGKSLFDL